MSNEKYAIIKHHFDDTLRDFLQTPSLQKLENGELSVDEYRCWLRQVFYYVRENPQIQTLGATFFRGKQRGAIRAIYKHAISELGHEQLALNDFVTLGGDPTTVPYKNPLPATAALNGFGYYTVYNLNPVGYLGYLFFLEFLPTQLATKIGQYINQMGVPENAQTYLREHIELDIEHNRMMERYIEQLVVSQSDLDSVKYTMTATANLFEGMLAASIAEAVTPVETGWNWEELNADGLTPSDFINQETAISAA